MATKSDVPIYVKSSALLPPTAAGDIEALRREGETANHVIHRALRGRDLESLRRNLPDGRRETSNDIIGRVLREAAADQEKTDATESIIIW